MTEGPDVVVRHVASPRWAPAAHAAPFLNLHVGIIPSGRRQPRRAARPGAGRPAIMAGPRIIDESS
jgi:hypothetical protein